MAHDSTDGDMIDTDVIQRVLGAGLRTGAEFAEVYVEDKRSSSANLDDGKVEQVTSGRDRGAGIRVVDGRDHRLRPHRRPQRVRAAGRGRGGRGRRREPGWRRGPRRRPHPQVRPIGCSDVAICPGRVGKAAKVDLLLRADEAARGAGRRHRAGVGRLRRQPQADPRGQLRRACWSTTSRSARCSASACVASGDTGLQTGYESLGHTIGFELFDQHDVEELARRAAQRALTKLNARPAPSGSLPVVIQPGERRRAVPRGLRPRPRGRPRRQGRLGVQGPGRRSWWPPRTSPWSTTAP